MSAIAHPQVPYHVEVGMLIHKGAVLLAQRGPETNPPDQRGRWAGIGGKLHVDEDLLVCLQREVMEEIGVDIINYDTLLYCTVAHDNFVVNYHAVYIPDEVDITINVPEAEQGKIANPQWYPLSGFPFEIIDQEMPHVITELLRYSKGVYSPTAAIGYRDKWLDRGAHTCPSGFYPICIENTDGMCTARALNAVLPPDEQIDLSSKARTLPKKGYRVEDLIDVNRHTVGIWHSRDMKWIHGGPECSITLMYTPNGEVGHMDALKKLDEGQPPQEVRYFTQGLCALRQHTPRAMSGAVTSEPTPPAELDAAAPTDVIIPEAPAPEHTGITSPPLPPLEPPKKTTTVFSNTAPQVMEIMGGARPRYTQRARDPHAIAPPSKDALATIGVSSTPQDGNTISLTSDFRTAALAMDRLHTVLTIATSSDVRQDVDHEQKIPFGSPAQGLSSITDALRADVLDYDIELTVNADEATAFLTLPVLEGSSSFVSTVAFDLAAGDHHDRFIPAGNTRPVEMTDKAYELGRELRTIFPALSNQIDSAALGEILGSVSDAPGASMVGIYELLWCGLFATLTGATAAPIPPSPIVARPGANHPGFGRAHIFDFLLPEHEVVASIFSAEAVGRMQPAPAPVQNQWNTTGCPEFLPRGDLTNYSIFPLRQIKTPTLPTINATSDWRQPLARLHEVYLGLVSNANFCEAGAVAVGPVDPKNRNCFLSDLGYQRPRLVLMTPLVLRVGRQGLDPNLHGTPRSWLDAIAVMLHLFASSADCIVGYTRALQHQVRFFSPTIMHLPTPIEYRFDNGSEIFGVLRRRLCFMRVTRPRYDIATNAAVRGTRAWGGLLAAINAVPTEQPDLWIPAGGVNAIPGPSWAIIQAIFPGVVRASFAVYQPPAPPADTGRWVDDGLWYQFFAAQPLLGDQESDIRNVLRQMTTSELQALMIWLSDDFHGRWMVHAGVGAAADFNLTITYNSPAAGAVDDDDIPDHIRRGAYLKRDWSLPLFNVIENKDVFFPAGLRRLRDAKMGIDNYNSDTVSITLAQRFAAMQPINALRVGLCIAAQQRAAVDVVADALGLNSALISRLSGTPVFGNTNLDQLIMNTTHKYFVDRSLDDLISSYVTSVNELIQRSGYATTFGTEFALGLSQIEFIDDTPFQYPPAMADSDCSEFPLLTWKVLHPLQVQMLLPGAPTSLGALPKNLRLFGAITPGMSFPWRDWHTNSSEVRDEDVFASYAIQMSLSGFKVRPRMIISVRPATGLATNREFEILSQYRNSPTRRSDSFPYAPTAATWFGCWYSSQLPYTANPYNDAGDLDFLERGTVHSMHMMERVSSLPPIGPIVKARPVKGTPGMAGSNRRFPSSPRGYDANGIAYRVINRLAGGMIAQTGNHSYVNNLGQTRHEYHRSYGWHSKQGSNNTERMRGEVAYYNINDTIRTAYNDGNILDHLQNNPPNGFLVGNSLGLDLSNANNLISYLPYAQEWNNNGDIYDQASIYARVVHRCEAWHFKPWLRRIPIIMSKYDPQATMINPNDYDPSTTIKSVGTSLSFGRMMDYMAGMNATALPIPSVPGLSNKDTEYLVYDRPQLVTGERYDPRTFVNAFSAVNNREFNHYDIAKVLLAMVEQAGGTPPATSSVVLGQQHARLLDRRDPYYEALSRSGF